MTKGVTVNFVVEWMLSMLYFNRKEPSAYPVNQFVELGQWGREMVFIWLVYIMF